MSRWEAQQKNFYRIIHWLQICSKIQYRLPVLVIIILYIIPYIIRYAILYIILYIILYTMLYFILTFTHSVHADVLIFAIIFLTTGCLISGCCWRHLFILQDLGSFVVTRPKMFEIVLREASTGTSNGENLSDHVGIAMQDQWVVLSCSSCLCCS